MVRGSTMIRLTSRLFRSKLDLGDGKIWQFSKKIGVFQSVPRFLCQQLLFCHFLLFKYTNASFLIFSRKILPSLYFDIFSNSLNDRFNLRISKYFPDVNTKSLFVGFSSITFKMLKLALLLIIIT